MKAPSTEDFRLEAVQRFLDLNLDRLTELQDIVDLAAELCQKPVALLTLLGKEYNWLKVRAGLDAEVMPRNTSFCQYAIEEKEILVIADTLQDARFDDNPLVQSDPHVRFYAGAPLELKNGLKLGTLCLFDLKPGQISALQEKTLIVLSRQVVALLERELGAILLKQQIEKTEAKNEALRKIAFMQSHEIRHPLTSIMGLVNLIRDGHHTVDQQWLEMISEATYSLDSKIQAIVNETLDAKDLKALRYQKMVEEIEDYAILLLDQNGTVENWNKGAEKLKGYKASEIIGRNFSVFYTEADQAKGRHKELIRLAIQQGSATDEGWRVRRDGSRFWARIVITAIHDYEGQVIGFTKITRDLSDVLRPVCLIPED
jgi:PAS domain S-box-containing protein